MGKFICACVAGTWLAIAAIPANATVIVQDFNDLAVNDVYSLTIGRVTYTAFGGGISTAGPTNTAGIGFSSNGTPGLVSYDSTTHRYNAILATIAGGTSFVSIDLGGFSGPSDTLFLTAYDLNGHLINFVYYTTELFQSEQTLSFAAPGIGSVAFGGQSFGAISDNFSFQSGVPEPRSWITLIAGFGMIGALSRRRHLPERLPQRV